MQETAARTPANNPVLVFDWGDTVMRVFPEFEGPMANWPTVAEVDGIVEALEGLKDRYHMVVASNAGDSHAPAVWRALRRVGLGEYFQAVFTANELGSSKPQLAFFRQLQNVLSRPSHELVMIGDSYTADVLGARQAGWLAAWYNPGKLPAPALMPLHDIEVHDLRRLPALLSRPPLPGYETCLAWLLESGTPHNIVQHAQFVASVAYLLACWLHEAGETLQPLLAHRGGLLHDLMKMQSITQNKSQDTDHARLAREALLARGQPELAAIADRHMPVHPARPDRIPETWEQKLVHFADKLAEGSRLVSLDDRMQALKERYPDYAGDIATSQPALQALQDEICARLCTTPAGLIERVGLSLSGRR